MELHPTELAERLGVSYNAEVKPLLRTPKEQIDFEYDILWMQILNLVSEKIGYCMAVRSEIDKAMQQDRSKRIQRYEQQRRRPRATPERPYKDL